MLQNNEKQKITKNIFLVFVAWQHFQSKNNKNQQSIIFE